MRTRLELLCKIHGQSGGTIHQFNSQYKTDFLKMDDLEFLSQFIKIMISLKEKEVSK